MASWTRWTTNYEMWRRWTERWTRYILKSLLLDVLYLLDILSSVLHPFSPVFYWIVKRRCFILHSGSWLVTFFYLFSRTLVWVIIYPIYSSVLLYTIYVNCPAQDRTVFGPRKARIWFKVEYTAGNPSWDRRSQGKNMVKTWTISSQSFLRGM